MKTAKLRRILLAEDSSKDVELTLMALEDVHPRDDIDVVRDGKEVLDYLYRRGEYAERASVDPVVVLLDLKMPRLNGLEVLECLKSDQSFRSMPVVMVSSSREKNDLIRSYELGVNAYVVKPIDFNDFGKAIRQLGVFWGRINEAPEINHGAKTSAI